MKIPPLTNRKLSYPALAFAIPFLGMLIVMLIRQCVPFGNYSFLYSDMYHQYYPFFKEFRRVLLSGESLLYNWSIGLGMDYLGLFAYYLASPLNLLSILIPEGWLLSFFSLLVPVKLGFASLFFSVFLKKHFHKNDFSISIFGSFYGLCAWALAYQWNIMWLDTFALLPMVILGMSALLRENRFFLYTVTLFLSIFANYYIGFFTCIFVLLCFFCYEICHQTSFRYFLLDLLRISLYSALAIGMTAILELPALSALQTTQASMNTFPDGFQLNITDQNSLRGLFSAMRLVAGNMNGGITPSFKEGLPNLYCGVCSIILSALYLFCHQVKHREKICAVTLLLFFNISFIIRPLDYIWHGFHFTNMIPYRFSFLHSFVMLYMAYCAWTYRKTFHLWQIILSSLIAIGIVLCTQDLSDVTFWAYNGVLLSLYISTLVYHTTFKQRTHYADKSQRESFRQARLTRKHICSLIFTGIMATELILNFVNFGAIFPRTDISNYPNGTDAAAAIIQQMKDQECDQLFYRTETTHTQTLNDGALNGYNGITAFTSSANVQVTKFMETLGYGAKDDYNRYSYEESSPVSNLFLSVQYMLERDGHLEENPYFDEVASNGNISLLKNNLYLPLGFLANSQLLNVDFSLADNRFDFQNQLMQKASGIKENVWHMIPVSCLTITGKGVTLISRPETGYCSYTSVPSENSTVIYSYTADREGFMCIDLDLSMKNNFRVLLNGTDLYSETYSLPQMLSVSQVRPGDVVEIQLECNENETGTIRLSGAILNDDILRQGYNNLSQSVLHVTSFENTEIEGVIDCAYSGILYTSIPQNGNWYAQVDGNPAEIILIGNAMIGLSLTEGTHSLHFSYHNGAYELGWKISLVCLTVLLLLSCNRYSTILYRKKGKFELK